MGKFRQIFAELSAHNTLMAGYYSLTFFIFSPKILISFLFLHENICCRYSLEAPRRGASNGYPQHMFSMRNKKNLCLI